MTDNERKLTGDERKLNLSLSMLLDRVAIQIAKSAKLAPDDGGSKPRFSFDSETWTVSARVAPRNDARVRATDISAHGDTPEDAVEQFIRVLPSWEQVLAPSHNRAAAHSTPARRSRGVSGT